MAPKLKGWEQSIIKCVSIYPKTLFSAVDISIVWKYDFINSNDHKITHTGKYCILIAWIQSEDSSQICSWSKYS